MLEFSDFSDISTLRWKIWLTLMFLKKTSDEQYFLITVRILLLNYL